MTKEQRRDATVVAHAYLNLLTVPLTSPTRTRLQPVLAGLRDEMAKLSGHDAELVQNLSEAVAEAFVKARKRK